MEIRITPEAHNDILGIYSYVKKDGEEIARKQVTDIYDGIENLTDFPNIGTPLQKHVERKTDLRYLVIRKVYIVIYEIVGIVNILRVFRKDQDFISALNIGNDR